MRTLLASIVLAVLAFSTYAQKTVAGKVLDATGESIPGAAVQIKGTSTGAITDIQGNFTLSVDSDDVTLVISFLGFVTQEVPLNGRTNLSITLQENVEELEEVVVVGYGTVRKSDLTGAVASVRVEDNVARQSNTVDQLLQGRAAGVQVTGGGQPGSGISVRIRGANSLRGNNEPLYVVDGIIISSAGEDAANASSDANTYQSAQNGLNGINPRDIESIEVLKDASATAIYGSRGANGVVLITTKKGTKGKVKINGYVTTSLTSVTRKLNMLNAEDYAQYQNESTLVLNNGNAKYQIEGANVYPIVYTDSNGPIVSSDPATTVNWQDQVFEVAHDYNVGLSFSGGTDAGDYYISAGYNDQDGIVTGSKYQTGDFRVNLTQNVTDRLKVDARLNVFYAKGSFAQDGDRAGGANRSFINNVVTFSPIITGDLDDYVNELGLTSPYSWINDFEDVSEEARLIGRFGLKYQLPIKGLSYEINIGGNVRDKERKRWYGLTTFKGRTSNGVLSTSDLVSSSYQINNLINYNNKLGKDHRLNAVLGFTIDKRNVNNKTLELQNFATTSFTVDQPFYGQLISGWPRIFYQPTDINSVLGRANYTFKNKYVLTATFRYDGVSKFQGDNKWSLFPTFALAWNASDETFVQNLNFFDELKIRAGWGQVGNHGINPFQTFANYDGVVIAAPSNVTSIAFVPTNIANPNLIWETTEQINAGIDVGIFDNRLTATVDVYVKHTNDLLQSLTLPPSAGFSTLSANRGSITNKGLEILLSGVVVDKGDFDLSISGNIAFNRTRIEELGIPLSGVYIDGVEEQRSFYIGDNISTGNLFKSPANIFMAGQPIGMFFGFETNGIYQSTDSDILAGKQPGDVRIIDQNNDGIIDNQDRTIIGDPNPDFIYGMNISAGYKKISLSVLINGVYGNEIANGNLLQIGNAEGASTNIIPQAYHNAWRPDRETNDYPRIGYRELGASAITDRIIEDGSYLRLGNVTLGYEVPVDNIKGISSLNIYVAGRNLVTFTKYSGFDPETRSFLGNGNIQGVDWVSVPNTRSITFGANITF